MKTNPEDCLQFETNLHLYVGGDLEPEAVGAMDAHRAACAPCRDREGRARASRDMLVSTLRVTERRGPDLWAGVRAGLATEGIVRPATAPSAPIGSASAASASAGSAPRPRRFVVPFALATAAAVTVGFFLGRLWLDRPAVEPVDPNGAHLVVNEPPRANDVVVPVLEPVNEAVGGSTLAETNGLRRLRPGESPLGAGAAIYTGFEWEDGPVLPDPYTPAPAALRTAPR